MNDDLSSVKDMLSSMVFIVLTLFTFTSVSIAILDFPKCNKLITVENKIGNTKTYRAIDTSISSNLFTPEVSFTEAETKNKVYVQYNSYQVSQWIQSDVKQ